MLASAVAVVGVGILRPTLYCLLHGGPSHDYAARCRDLIGIQKRGGWKSFSSVRRYEKAARLGQQWAKLSGPLQDRVAALATQAVSSFSTCFIRRVEWGASKRSCS